ncbi:MAG: hypothetical protein CVV41_19310 [Candidatus Riflebacteria bacterium HGW-Riflebacteria-1]|jgi:hypothetical protein|nr:MAG: hypothetical protein CVV41_19310 [Candidatus Riflebacteria bacterium HGW-Riflebacteria-1]
MNHDARRHFSIHSLRKVGFSPTWQSHEQKDCFVATLLTMTFFKHVFNYDSGLDKAYLKGLMSLPAGRDVIVSRAR